MRRILVVLAVLMAVLAPTSAFAQDVETTDAGFLLRIGGDTRLAAGEKAGVLIAINSDAVIAGDVETLLVIGGKATLAGGHVSTLTIVNGTADLQAGSRVDRDVRLVNSDIVQASGVTIGGEVRRGTDADFWPGLAWLGFVLYVGFSVFVIAAGVVLAGIAGRQMTAAGNALTGELPKSLLGALILWIGLPVLAVFAFATIVGIPVGFAVLLIVIPMLAFLGYVVAGIRLGSAILQALKAKPEEGHPYLSALVGLIILQIVMAVPALGAVIAFVAALVGAGALGLVAWRAARGPRAPAVAARHAPSPA